MGLNCKPGQRAWICVPRTPQTELLGLVQLHGRVVQTVRLLDTPSFVDPTWAVDPPQSCTVAGPVTERMRERGIAVGVVMNAAGVPDSYLRPFKDFPPEEVQDLYEQLKRELAL